MRRSRGREQQEARREHQATGTEAFVVRRMRFDPPNVVLPSVGASNDTPFGAHAA